MNKGTKIRTVLAFLTTINTVLAVTDVTQFGNEKLNLAYKIISVIVNALVVGINTWYNNDYTPEACIGTGVARQLKAEKGENYVGDFFFTQENESYDTAGIELSDNQIQEIVDECAKADAEIIREKAGDDNE